MQKLYENIYIFQPQKKIVPWTNLFLVQLGGIPILRHQRGGWVGSENGNFYSIVNHQRS